MNSLHTSLPQKTPVRGVALRPQGEDNRRDATLPRSSMTTTAAIQQHRATLFDRSMEALRKATRGSVMPHLVVFLCLLFSSVGLATAQNQAFWRNDGGGLWGSPASWSSTASGSGGTFRGGQVPGPGDEVYFVGITASVSFPSGVGIPTAQVSRILVQRDPVSGNSSNITFASGNVIISTNASPNSPVDQLFVESGSTLKIGTDPSSASRVLVGNTNTSAPGAENIRIFGILILEEPDTDALIMSIDPTTIVTAPLFVPNGFAAATYARSTMIVKEGGVLSLRTSGTGTNNGLRRVDNTNTSIVYEQGSGGFGILEYANAGTALVTIPDGAAVTNEIPGNNILTGSLRINRPVATPPNEVRFSPTAAAPGYTVRGHLILQSGVLRLPTANTRLTVGDDVGPGLGGTVIPQGGLLAGDTTTVAPILPRSMLYIVTPTTRLAAPASPTTPVLSFETGKGRNRLVRLEVLGAGQTVSLATNLMATTVRLQPAATTTPTETKLLIQPNILLMVGDTVDASPANGGTGAGGTSSVAGLNANLNSSALIDVQGHLAVASNATLHLEPLAANGLGTMVIRNNGLLRLFNARLNIAALGEPAAAAAGIISATSNPVQYEPRTAFSVGGTLEYTKGSAPRHGTAGEINDRATTDAEFPQPMNGNVNITSGIRTAGTAAELGFASVILHNNRVINGVLTIQTGDLRLNGRTLTIGTTGSISNAGAGGLTTSSDVGGATATVGALIYNSNVSGFLRLTQSPSIVGVAPHNARIPSTYLNQLEVNGTGTLSLLSSIKVDGLNAPAAPVVAAPGRVFVATGSFLSLNGSSIEFRGNNTTGGFIDTVGSTGIINGAIGSSLNFDADRTSGLRMGSGGTNGILQNLSLGVQIPGAVDRKTRVTLLSSVNLINLTLFDGVGGGILRLRNGANLTIQNNYVTVPTINNFFVDVTGGSLTILNIAASRTFHVGATYDAFTGLAQNHRYSPVTINNGGAMDNYTVRGAAPPTNGAVTDGVNFQWFISKTNAVSGTTSLQFAWYGINTQFSPTDQPELSASFQTDRANATIRQWTGTNFISLPTTGFGTGPLTNTFTVSTALTGGILSNTPYVISTDPIPLYWISPSSNNWADGNNWSFTPGGSAAGTFPGVNDIAIFDRFAPNISTGIPASIQRMEVIGTAAPIFSQNQVLSLRRDKGTPDNVNLIIATTASLTLQTGTIGGTRVVLSSTSPASGSKRALIFGRLTLGEGGTFEVPVNAAPNQVVVGNGGTLRMSGGVFTKDAAAVLVYDPTAAAVTPALTSSWPFSGTLEYNDATVATVNLPANVTTQEIPNSQNLANFVVNRTGAGAIVTAPTAIYTVSSNANIITGRLNLTALTGVQPFTVGQSGIGALTVNGTYGIGAASIMGSYTLRMDLVGLGNSTLNFTDGFQQISRLNINNVSATVTQNSNLIVSGNNPGLDMSNANRSFGYMLPAGRRLTLANGGANNIGTTVGRMWVDGGTLEIVTAATNAVIAQPGNLVIGTNGTLLLNNLAAGAITTNHVLYTNATASLVYTNGTTTLVASDLEFPPVMPGSVVLNKTSNIATSIIELNSDKTINGTTTLQQGYFRFGNAAPFERLLTMNGALGGTSAYPLPPTPGGFFVNDDPSTTRSAIAYNNPVAANLRLTSPNPTSAVALQSLMITNATVTLQVISNTATPVNSALAIDGNVGTYQPQAGQLALNGTAQLRLNNNELRFTGNGTTGGTLPFGQTGTIAGDAGALTGVRFRATRGSTLRMSQTGTDNLLTNLEVNAAAGTPVIPLVTTATNVVANNLIFSPTDVAPVGGGGVVQVPLGINLKVSSTNAIAQTTPHRLDNNFADLSVGGTLTLNVPTAGVTPYTVFPVGTTRATGSVVNYTPVAITNPGATSEYTVGVQSIMSNQAATYPNRAVPEWTISKAGGSAPNNVVSFQWNVGFEAGTFNRPTAFIARWNGLNYDNIGNTLTGPTITYGPDDIYLMTHTVGQITSLNNTKFLILNPPSATTLVPDPTNVNGLTTLNGGNTIITSQTPFPITLTTFNSLAPPVPVTALGTHNIFIDIAPAAGGTATFATVGSGSTGAPILATNFANAATPNFQINWLNPGTATSTSAILKFYSISGGNLVLTSFEYPITVNAPPLRSAVLAISRVENSSTGTQGLNGGGLDRFNIIGGVQFPADLGFFSYSNFLVATDANTTIQWSVAAHPSNPGAVFTLTPPINGIINTGQTGGRVNPIVNLTGGGTPNTGVALANLTFSVVGGAGSPNLRSTTVTIYVGTGATVPTRLGYAVNSGSLVNTATGTPLGAQGFNNGILNPITSTTPFPINFASFAENGMVIRPILPTPTLLSVAANTANPTANFILENDSVISDTLNKNLSGNAIGTLRPRITWTNPSAAAGYAQADVTLTQLSGTTLLSTTVTVSIFTTGNVAVTLAMSQVSTNGTQGISINNSPVRQGGNGDPIRASSGTPFNIDYGFYNAWGLPASGYVANGSFTVTVTPPGGEIVTLDGAPVTFLPFPVTRGRISNITLNWRNPVGANPPPIDVVLTLSAPFASLGIGGSTSVTIRLSSSANVPAFLGLSQVSSTSSVGINNGSLNVVSGTPINIDAGLFDLQGALTRSLANVNALLSIEALPGVSGSSNVSIAGNTAGVFVNQSGIRFNNIVLNWNNPTSNPPTTQVRVRISTTGSARADDIILSTSAIVTISAGNVFPRISNLSPSVGGPGTEVQITGVNFLGVNSVTFNGIPAQSFTVLGDGVIRAIAPGGVSTGEVRVSRPQQGAIPAGSNTGQVPPAIFTTGLAPAITELVPSAGGIGTRVLIRGANLFNVSDVRIANIRAVVVADPNINNSTTGSFIWVELTGPLLSTIGTLSEGRTGTVTMATLGGVVSSTQIFTYNPPPVITSITPNTAVANGQSVSVIIRGTGFNFPLDPSQSANPIIQQSGVYFNITNNPMAISPAQRVSVQSVTPTEIRATISGSFTNVQGQRYVYVQNQDGQFTFIPFQLTPNQPPVITSITPNITTATGVAFEAIVNGSNFFGQNSLGVTARTATGQVVNLSFRAVSPSQVVVTIPASLNTAAQNLTITLLNSDGQSASVGFIVREPMRPSIASVSPSRAVVGSSTMTVTIIGSGFFLNAIPSLGITDLQVVSRSTSNIVAIIPASLLTTFGSPTISVRNPGSFSTSIFFPIGYPAPTVTSVVTASGPNQGQPVTAASIFPFQLAVNGTGFRVGLSATFNGQAITVVSTSPTQVVVQVPSGLNTPGVFPVAISNTDGQSASGLFTIGTPNGPIITSISPREEVAIGQPFVITLDGRNFSVNAQGQILAGTQVLFNGVPLAILSASSTRLQVQVPAGLNTREGNALIEVVNSDLQRTSIPLTVGCSICPIVRSFTPTTVRPTNNTGFDVTFTFRGSNLSPNSTITIGGSPLRIVSGSDSVITAIAPPGFFFGNGSIVVTNPDGRRFTLAGPTVGVSNVVTTPLAGRAYPNPVDDMLSFETDITSTTLLRVRLSDMLGRTVTSFEQQVQRGRFVHQLDVSGLSAGVYIFEMSDGQRRFTEKIMKR